jgi:hypothetical protein
MMISQVLPMSRALTFFFLTSELSESIRAVRQRDLSKVTGPPGNCPKLLDLCVDHGLVVGVDP